MHTYGLKRDSKDPRDRIHDRGKALFARLPRMIDLRSKCSPVVDQGALGSCTANAIVSGLREYELYPHAPSLSRLFLYWEERAMEGTVGTDSGAMIRDGMKVLQKLGVCPEEDCPYDISKFTDEPSKKASVDAFQYRIPSYLRVTNLQSLKLSLSRGLPVVIGFNVYESFESPVVARTGIAPMPKRGESILGGHAVLVVGYDDTKKWLIVRNSWGTSWGDAGYFYMPYTVFPKLVTDMWTQG